MKTQNVIAMLDWYISCGTSAVFPLSNSKQTLLLMRERERERETEIMERKFHFFIRLLSRLKKTDTPYGCCFVRLLLDVD